MLELLVKYSRDHGLEAEPGFKPKDVRWGIRCTPAGRFLEIVELGGAAQARNLGQTFRKCPELTQPEIKRGGAGCRPFLVDSLAVVTLFGKSAPKEDEKLLAKHEYFLSLLHQASAEIPVPVLASVARILENPADREVINTSLAASRAKSTDKVTFSVQGHDPAWLVDSDVWHDWWREFRRQLREGDGSSASMAPRMRCLASGALVEPVRTLPKVSGLADVGGLSAGDALSSYKQDAFASYGLTQSANAAVSEEAANHCRAALDELIRKHGHRLAGTKVVHWFKKRVRPQDDPLPWLTSDPETAEKNAQQRANELIEAIRSGTRPDLANNYYYALTLSGASGRVMVRDWMEGRFEVLVRNVAAWFDDLAIVRSDGTDLAPPPKFLAVLGALVREKLDELPPPISAKMWRVAVRREGISYQVLARALGRVRLDIMNAEGFRHARMGLLRAYHVRKEDVAMRPTLNEEHPDPAYHCGRLMAVLARLQWAALGDVGAGVVQRYYAAASSTPALVLGRLTRTSQFHLGKLDRGLAHWFESKIGAVWSSIRDHVPGTLSLEEQSLFALGYYHQLAADRAKLADSDDSEASES